MSDNNNNNNNNNEGNFDNDGGGDGEKSNMVPVVISSVVCMCSLGVLGWMWWSGKFDSFLETLGLSGETTPPVGDISSTEAPIDAAGEEEGGGGGGGKKNKNKKNKKNKKKKNKDNKKKKKNKDNKKKNKDKKKSCGSDKVWDSARAKCVVKVEKEGSTCANDDDCTKGRRCSPAGYCYFLKDKNKSNKKKSNKNKSNKNKNKGKNKLSKKDRDDIAAKATDALNKNAATQNMQNLTQDLINQYGGGG